MLLFSLFSYSLSFCCFFMSSFHLFFFFFSYFLPFFLLFYEACVGRRGCLYIEGEGATVRATNRNYRSRNKSSANVCHCRCVYVTCTDVICDNSNNFLCIHNTYHVVAYFHYVLSMGDVFASIVRFIKKYPLFTGLTLNLKWLKAQFTIMFVGVNTTFFSQNFLRLAGMSRQ